MQPVGAHPCGDVSGAVSELAGGVLSAVYRTVDVQLSCTSTVLYTALTENAITDRRGHSLHTQL